MGGMAAATAPLRFRLAPMAGVIRWLTYALLLMPVAFLVAGLFAPPLAIVGVFEAAIYLGVWLWFRPSAFEIGDDALMLRWPVRRRRVPFAAIAGAETVSGKEFRRRYGWGMRVGAGGLWGGFGQLWTPHGRLDFYVSRTDAFVLVHLAQGRPLMLTPEQPDRFAAALQARAAGSPSPVAT